MIRAFSPAGGSTIGTISANAGSTPPSCAISGCGSGHVARCARTAASSSASSAPRTNAPAISRTSSQVSSRWRPVPLMATPSSVRRMASRPRRIRLLTVPSGAPGPLGDLTLGEPAEVGELERLALDVRERLQRRANGLGVQAGGHLGPDVGQGQRRRQGRLDVRQFGRRTAPPDRIDRAVVDDRQQPGLDAAAPFHVPGGIAPRPEEGVLNDVLGERGVIRDAVGD